ncbi:MAG: hypothetical protein ACREMS_01700 [Gemmatimonadaceae bacterium]
MPKPVPDTTTRPPMSWSDSLHAFPAAPTVTLTGKAQSCNPGLPIRLLGVGDVKISAFRVDSVPSLMAYLNAFDTTGASEMMRLDTLLTKADSVARISKALGRAVSDSLGIFRFTIPVTDSVLIYATWYDDGDTFPEAHITMSGRTSREFVLDIAHGGCSLPSN